MLLATLLIAPALAIPPTPQTIIASSTTGGILIAAPAYNYVKANHTFDFNFHLFNSTNGMPLTAKDNVSCSFHLYNPYGNHIYIKSPVTVFEHEYDMGVEVDAGNFTKGFYNVIFQCNGTYAVSGKVYGESVGGYIKQEFEVTNTGIAPATGGMIIFTFIIFILLTVGMIYCAIMCLSGFVGNPDKPGEMKGVKIEWVIANICVFIIMLIFVWFNDNYFGNILVKDMMSWYIDVGAFTNVLIPLIAYVVSITIIQILNIRKKREDDA